LQLGLARVNEADNGDFTVKLKERPQTTGSTEIVSDIRGQMRKASPQQKSSSFQLLQDMIGDLTSQPEPVVIKTVFPAPDGKLLTTRGERWRRPRRTSISKVKGVVDV